MEGKEWEGRQSAVACCCALYPRSGCRGFFRKGGLEQHTHYFSFLPVCVYHSGHE